MGRNSAGDKLRQRYAIDGHRSRRPDRQHRHSPVLTISDISGNSSSATFTINLPPPTITSLSPAFVVVGCPAFTMTISGTNFTSISTAMWSSTPLAVTYISSTQLAVAIPAILPAHVGTPNITVSNTSGTSSGAAFNVNPPAPAITGLSPAAAFAGGTCFHADRHRHKLHLDLDIELRRNAIGRDNSSTQLQMTATVPAALIASVGTASITVSNVTGSSPARELHHQSAATGDHQPQPFLDGCWWPRSLLTINGANFDAASIASCGSTALATTLLSATQLTATLPAALTANPGTGSLTVSTDGGISSAVAFTILPPPPAITSLSPAFTVAGGAVFTLTITGTNFTSTSAALWNTTKLATTYVNSTQLTVAVPASLIASAGTPSITVSTTGGVSPAATFTINPPAPTITSLNPSIVLAGGAAYTLTITGTNFTTTSTVLWGSTPLTATYISAAQLTVSVPASLIANSGRAGVKVSNVTGSSSSATVTINPPPPAITSLTPGSVLMNNGAFTMTVNGSSFQPGAGATVVRWGNAALATTYVNSTQVTAAVPANLLPYGSTSINVITAYGISPSFPFTVTLPAPKITVLGMTQVPAGFGSFTMNAYGTYFTPTMVLNWGSTPLSGTLVGGGTFTFTVPANLVTTVGPVSLTVTTAGGTSAPVTFTIAQPSPTVTSISPTSIPAGSAAFKLTVNGSNFTSSMNTKWGSTWIGANVISSTQLWVTVPASMVATAGTADVMVYTSWRNLQCATLHHHSRPSGHHQPESQLRSPPEVGVHADHQRNSLHPNHHRNVGHDPSGHNLCESNAVEASVPASLIANSGTASISVISPAGTSVSATFIINPAPPAISGLSPGVATAGGAAFNLTINGAYFTPSTTSKWGSTPLTTTYISSTQLTARGSRQTDRQRRHSQHHRHHRRRHFALRHLHHQRAAQNHHDHAALRNRRPRLLRANQRHRRRAGILLDGHRLARQFLLLQHQRQHTHHYRNTRLHRRHQLPGLRAGHRRRHRRPGHADHQCHCRTQRRVNNASLNGSYTCLLQGSIDDDGTRWASILSFQADGQGNFSNGIFDTNSYDIGSASGIVSGSYNIGADNNGLASIHTILTNNAAGIQTTQWAIALSGSAQPAAEFRMVEADDLGKSPSGQQGTANCYLATPSAFAASTISGSSFAFGMDGEDNNSNLKATAGQFSASNGSHRQRLSRHHPGRQRNRSGRFFHRQLHRAGPRLRAASPLLSTARAIPPDTPSTSSTPTGCSSSTTPPTTASRPAICAPSSRRRLSTAALSGPFVLYARGAAFNANSGIPTSFYANLLLGAGDGAGNMTIQQSYANNAGSYTAGKSNGGPTALAFDPANPGRASFQTANGTTYLYFFNANSAFEMSVGSNGSMDSGWLEAQSAAQSQPAFTNAALAGNISLRRTSAAQRAANRLRRRV